MYKHIVQRTIVLSAPRLLPTRVGQLWMLKNEILSEGDFASGCVFSDAVVHVKSNKSLEFTAFQNQIQFHLAAKLSEFTLEKIVRISERLPDKVKVTGVGLNFTGHLHIENEEDLGSESRDILGMPSGRFASSFDNDDARFGAYYSKTFQSGKLNMEVKPAAYKDSEMLNVAFNFHADTAEIDDVKAHLERWKMAAEEVERIFDMSGVESR